MSGALTHTTMLVEVGDMHFMQAPVDVEINHGTVRETVRQIMGATARYTLRDQKESWPPFREMADAIRRGR